jgi:hypothetical protein
MSRYLRNRQKPYHGPNYSVRRVILIICLLLALAYELGLYR